MAKGLGVGVNWGWVLTWLTPHAVRCIIQRCIILNNDFFSAWEGALPPPQAPPPHPTNIAHGG